MTRLCWTSPAVTRLAREGTGVAVRAVALRPVPASSLSMLDVAVPEHDGVLLTPESRAIREDRLSQAGFNV